MLIRVIFFLNFFICFSQESILLDSLNSNYHYLEHSEYTYEINNLGDPIISFVKKTPVNNFLLNHTSQEVRKIDFLKKGYTIKKDTIWSYISYQSSYSMGGLLNTFLTRPIGKNMRLVFNYNNLSSEGFYNNQHNKYSNLFLQLDFTKPELYSCSFFGSSLNAQYEQFGGLSLYDNTVSTNLLGVYLQSAQTMIKNRFLKFSQTYFLKSDLKLKHDFNWSTFYREYVDPLPLSSFYYSLTPLDYLIVSDYNLNTFLYTISNEVSIDNTKLKFAIKHNYYNTNDLIKNDIRGDFVTSLSSINSLKENNKSFNFLLAFCPIGYNKNNYLVDLKFNKKSQYFNNTFITHFSTKKPHFFREHYNNFQNWNWSDFESSSFLSFKIQSVLKNIHLKSKISVNRISRFFYFNELASPSQLTEPLVYIQMELKKDFLFKDISLNSAICLQYSDNNALSVPLIFYYQKINYHRVILSDIKLNASFSGYLFSKYFPNTFFPLTDVFYNQTENKSLVKPFLSSSIYIAKKNFSVGLIFDNVQNIVLEESYFIDSYQLPSPTIRFSVQWLFLD